MKTFSLNTLGCKVNQLEGEKIKSILIANGLKEKPFGGKTDISIVNTCSVTSVADAKSRQSVNKAIKTAKNAYVTGCSVENKDFNVKDGAKIIRNKEKIKYFEKLFGLDNENFTFRARPLIKIQDGCNQKCSYCIVPVLRGESKSREADTIIKEIENLVNKGFEELVITGINIGIYNDNGNSLGDLLKKINNINERFRVRLSSIELNGISEKVIIELVRNNSKIVKHLHVPLQSGSDKILKQMNRPYKSSDFIKKAKELTDRGFTLTTDCIVGFPQETQNDFNLTLEVINKVGFSKVHVFRYSKRPFTKACENSDEVSEIDKKQRAVKLQKNADRLRDDFITKQVGKEHEVLCEKMENNEITGVTSNYIKVKFNGDSNLLKKLATVRILKVSKEYCKGEITK